MALTQKDFPAVWPDTGRPCPWSADGPLSWPVVFRSGRGDVWQLGADRFAVHLAANLRAEFATREEAVASLTPR